jgi:hypothetical protein
MNRYHNTVLKDLHFTPRMIEVVMLWNVTVCSVAGGHQCFGGPATFLFRVQLNMIIFYAEMFAKLKMITASAFLAN